MTWGMAVVSDDVGDERCFRCKRSAEFCMGGIECCSGCAGFALRDWLRRRKEDQYELCLRLAREERGRGTR